MVTDDTRPVPSTMTINAIRIGRNIRIYLVSATNLVIVALYMFEMAGTEFWQNLPWFDITNVKDCITGASAGGTEVAEGVKCWNGDPSNRIAGKVQIIVKDSVLHSAANAGSDCRRQGSVDRLQSGAAILKNHVHPAGVLQGC